MKKEKDKMPITANNLSSFYQQEKKLFEDALENII